MSGAYISAWQVVNKEGQLLLTFLKEASEETF